MHNFDKDFHNSQVWSSGCRADKRIYLFVLGGKYARTAEQKWYVSILKSSYLFPILWTPWRLFIVGFT